jgi:hypothetical protein
MMRIAAVFLISVALFSCSNASAPTPTATAIVQGVITSPEVNGDLGRVDATIAVEIHNPFSVTLRFWGCAVSLERERDDGGWDYVWSPLCLAAGYPVGTGPGVAIPSGSTLQTSVRVSSDGHGTEWPSTGLSGNYRLRVHLIPDVDWNSERRVARFLQENWRATISNEFSFSEN